MSNTYFFYVCGLFFIALAFATGHHLLYLVAAAYMLSNHWIGGKLMPYEGAWYSYFTLLDMAMACFLVIMFRSELIVLAAAACVFGAVITLLAYKSDVVYQHYGQWQLIPNALFLVGMGLAPFLEAPFGLK